MTTILTVRPVLSEKASDDSPLDGLGRGGKSWSRSAADSPTPVTPQDGCALGTPRLSKVFDGYASHSSPGSKGLVPPWSPCETEALRRSVLSAVPAAVEPHSVPGSNPIWPITS